MGDGELFVDAFDGGGYGVWAYADSVCDLFLVQAFVSSGRSFFGQGCL
jgi:hypothetical protein